MNVSLTLGSNIASLQSQRRLGETENTLARVFERLSSGQRINRASDDAAGLAISESLRAEQRILAQGVRNINDGISALNIADSATGELQGIVERLKELASQSANGVFSVEQRQALQTESRELTREYNRIVATTEFNGRQLLDGSFGSAAIEFGAGEGILITPGDGLSDLIASGEFTGSLDFFAGGSDVVLDAVDYDGDGDLDLLTFDGGTQIRLLENDGSGGYSVSGSFSAISTQAGSGGNFEAQLADLDGDGDLDLVTSGLNGGNSILLNDGTGNYTAISTSGLALGNFELGDFNGDGRTDVYSNGVAVSFNEQGEFTVSAVVTNPGEGFSYDVNGDGFDDIIRVSAGQSLISYGSADGLSDTFEVFADFEIDQLGDFDGDGQVDLVQVSGTSAAVYLGYNYGDYDSRVDLDTGLSSIDPLVSVVDFNEDGLDDLVFGSTGEGFSVFQANDSGGFEQSTELDSNFSTSFLRGPVFGDFNGDGAIDVLAEEYAFQSESTNSSKLAQIDISSQRNARDALDLLETFDLRLSEERSNLGALQSRLSVALTTVDATRENYAAADSRIRDADIAGESADLVRNNILRQAAASVLAQANQQPQLALLLLG